MAAQNMIDISGGFFGHGESDFDGPRAPKLQKNIGFGASKNPFKKEHKIEDITSFESAASQESKVLH